MRVALESGVAPSWPPAIANGPVWIVRCPIEGLGWKRDEDGPLLRWIKAPGAFVLGGLVGAYLGTLSVAAGTAELMTGGYFEIVPEDWTTLKVGLDPECMVTRCKVDYCAGLRDAQSTN